MGEKSSVPSLDVGRVGTCRSITDSPTQLWDFFLLSAKRIFMAGYAEVDDV